MTGASWELEFEAMVTLDSQSGSRAMHESAQLSFPFDSTWNASHGVLPSTGWVVLPQITQSRRSLPDVSGDHLLGGSRSCQVDSLSHRHCYSCASSGDTANVTLSQAV